MKINRNNIAFVMQRSKMIRARRIKNSSFKSSKSSRKTTSRTSNSLASKYNSIRNANNKKTSVAQTLLGETKENYTNMKTAAEEAGKHLEILMETGEDSLFGTEEKKADTEKICSEVKEVVEAYNDMVEAMTKEGGTVNEMYMRQLHGFVVSNKSKLEKVGITENKSNQLTIDKDKLKNAETEVLKELFQGDGSFADKLADRSKKIIDNADTNLNSLNNATYSSLLSNYGTSGSLFNSKA